MTAFSSGDTGRGTEGARDDVLDLVMALAEPAADDVALDVAIFPSLATLAVAPAVDSLVAVADRPDVLEEGQRLAAEIGIDNVEFALADLLALPYHEGTFSLVLACQALHVSPNPPAALAEIQRVTRPGGRVVIAEPVVDEVTAEAFNELARLREPAHRQYLHCDELTTMAEASGLRLLRQERARHSVDLGFWVQTASTTGSRAALVQERFLALPVEVQVALDVAFSDGAISFSYDVCGLLLARD